MPRRIRAGHPPIRRCVGIAAVALAAWLARQPFAQAHANGIVADSCDGCHGSGLSVPPDVAVTADPATLSPGSSVTFTLTIRSPGIQDGGAYVTTGGVGTLQALAGEGLAVNAQGLTHTAPKPASNGAVTFRFGWKAPATPGAVDVHVAVLAGNGNDAPTGDSPGIGDFQWVFGCTAVTFYADLDRDGYGSSLFGTKLGCVGDPTPTGYATKDGDCDENDEMVHPGATEVCNMKDDNCDGQIDENAPPAMMWPDGDGDGYYTYQTGTPKLGCGNIPGYASRGGDCDDKDPTVHPGATEVCNLKDDNCDGRIDEFVRPTCGVGWCARYSPTCNPADCVPGPPAKEICNSFDDDCDGELDNGACPAGMICSGSQCVTTSGTGSDATGGGGGSAAGAGGTPAVTTGGAGGARGGAGSGPASSASGCAIAPASPGWPGRGGRGGGGAAAGLGVGLGLLIRRRRRRR